MMRPYSDGYLPVSRAADAVRNQAETILDELHGSINRTQAFRAKMAARAEEKAHRAELLTRINQMNDDLRAELDDEKARHAAWLAKINKQNDDRRKELYAAPKATWRRGVFGGMG